LSAGYGGSPVLDGVNFSISAGKTLAVIGPSGCGKTTLMRAIGRFRDGAMTMSGVIRVGDVELHETTPCVGVVFQDAPVFEHLTVWDNLCFGHHFRDERHRDVLNARAVRLLDSFGLAPSLAHRRASTLSGGQRQRLALATALANAPDLLLLDEPFGALDALTRLSLQEFFVRRIHGAISAIFVTHDLNEALLVGDRILVVNEGISTVAVPDLWANALPGVREADPAFTELKRSLFVLLQKKGQGDEGRE
jgi:sulfate transport system ATP-binding protein